jgi:hypothetical protein
MAARRLILVMLVLLVLSSAVAALIPVERSSDDESTTTTTTTTAAAPTGELVRAHVDADAKKAAGIRIHKGDQVELTVSSSTPGQVEIPVLGMLEDVDRFIPARFDLLPFDRGTYEVRLLPQGAPTAADRVVGRVIVGGPR